MILMAGALTDDEQLLYPVSDLAAKYGGVRGGGDGGSDQAYARFGPPKLERPASWEQLPWVE